MRTAVAEASPVTLTRPAPQLNIGVDTRLNARRSAISHQKLRDDGGGGSSRMNLGPSRSQPFFWKCTRSRSSSPGLVTRTVYPTIPPRVEYELTKPGRSLYKPIAGVASWVRRNRPAIEAARQAYDAGGTAKPSHRRGLKRLPALPKNPRI